MALPRFQDEIETILRPEAAPDWAALFGFAETLKDLERQIDKVEGQLTTWRASLMAKFNEATGRLDAFHAQYPEVDISGWLTPMLDEVIQHLDKQIASAAKPLHDRPEFAEARAKLSAVQGPPARYFRKMVRRIEDVRVKHHKALVDVYYLVLAQRADHDPEAQAGQRFSEPTALGDYLRKQIA